MPLPRPRAQAGGRALEAPRPGSPAAIATTPPAGGGPLAGKVVVIDPGHNPHNPGHVTEIDALVNAGGFLKACDTVGAETDAGYPEFDFTLDVARRARVILRAAGAKVILTQNGSTAYGPCVTQRAAIGNRARADAAISIHADGGPPDGYGFAVLVPVLVQNAVGRQQHDHRAIALSGRRAPHALCGSHRPGTVHLPRLWRHPAPIRPRRTQPARRCQRCSSNARTCATRRTRPRSPTSIGARPPPGASLSPSPRSSPHAKRLTRKNAGIFRQCRRLSRRQRTRHGGDVTAPLTGRWQFWNASRTP